MNHVCWIFSTQNYDVIFFCVNLYCTFVLAVQLLVEAQHVMYLIWLSLKEFSGYLTGHFVDVFDIICLSNGRYVILYNGIASIDDQAWKMVFS